MLDAILDFDQQLEEVAGDAAELGTLWGVLYVSAK